MCLTLPTLHGHPLQVPKWLDAQKLFEGVLNLTDTSFVEFVRLVYALAMGQHPDHQGLQHRVALRAYFTEDRLGTCTGGQVRRCSCTACMLAVLLDAPHAHTPQHLLTAYCAHSSRCCPSTSAAGTTRACTAGLSWKGRCACARCSCRRSKCGKVWGEGLLQCSHQISCKQGCILANVLIHILISAHPHRLVPCRLAAGNADAQEVVGGQPNTAATGQVAQGAHHLRLRGDAPKAAAPTAQAGKTRATGKRKGAKE